MPSDCDYGCNLVCNGKGPMGYGLVWLDLISVPSGILREDVGGKPREGRVEMQSNGT